MVAKYRSVLGYPGAIRLLSSALLGRLPQGMSSLAILLLVRGATHSYAAAGLAVGAEALAAAASAPPLGRLIDRFGRRVVLGPLAVAQACVYVLLVLAATNGAGAAVLIFLSLAAGVLLPPIAPVVRALLREIFRDPATRETAYALEAVAQESIWIVGPLVVAVVIAIVSPEVAVLMLAAVAVTGTWWFLRTPLVDAAADVEPRPRRAGSPLSSEDLRWLLAPVALTGAALGAIEVGLPSLAIHAGSRPAAGLLLALWSVGSMAGGLWYSVRTWDSPLGSRYVALLLAAAVAAAPLLVARSIPAAAACSFLAGLATAPTFSCQYSLVSHVVGSGTSNEAFSWISSALVGGIAAGSAIGGAVIGPVGVIGPFVIACAVSVLGALLALRFRGRFEMQAEPA